MRRSFSLHALCLLVFGTASAHDETLRLRQDDATHTISVYRENGQEAILTQNARPDFRLYLHPIVAPDGKGLLTNTAQDITNIRLGCIGGSSR